MVTSRFIMMIWSLCAGFELLHELRDRWLLFRREVLLWLLTQTSSTLPRSILVTTPAFFVIGTKKNPLLSER